MKLYRIFNDFIERLPLSQKWGVDRVKQVIYASAGILLLIVILSIILPGDTSTEIDWAVVHRGNFRVELVESGDIEALSQVDIRAPMMWGASLKVIDLVPEGTQVKKGDFLLQFDVTDLQDQLKLREDQLISLEADLEKLKAQQALTISNLENSLKLTTYSYEQAELQLEMRKFESQVRQEEARLQLKQAEIQLEKVKKQLASQRIIHASQIVQRETAIREAQNRVRDMVERINRLQLRAPTDGMVVYQQIRGERVKEGYESRPGWPLMAIPDLSRMQVKVFINEVDRLEVERGQGARIVLDAYPDTTFHGMVREVARLGQIVTGEERLKGFVIYIDIDGEDPKLKPGLTAQVRIVLDELENVIYIPLGTVFEIDGKPCVFRKGKNNPLFVELGPRNDGYVVVEDGLEPGMELSWQSPEDEDIPLLGMAEEKKRIDEINRTIRESFSVFQNRGILFDYGSPTQETDSGEEDEKTTIDLDKLPASIRQRLGTKKQGQTSSKPRVEVGTPEGRQRSGTFKVSPEMMERLQQQKQPEKGPSPSSQKK